MDMLDTSMASVRLTLMLMPTPSDRSLLDSQSTTPELLPDLLTPLPSTLDPPPMLLPPTPPDILDILATLVLAILVLSMVKLLLQTLEWQMTSYPYIYGLL